MREGLVVKFSEVDKEDIALVGGKGANLGEMIRNGFPVPDGFIITSKAYYQFLKENGLIVKIKHLIQSADFNNSESLSRTSRAIKEHIIKGNVSKELAREILKHYKKLGGIFKDALVAVRSSATAEDLPTASFAGQQETFLNVRGEANLIQKVKQAWASLFEARALFYRKEQGFDHFKIGIAVPVQKMVESDASGVMFTIDPVTNDKQRIVIEAIYGLGELIVQGKVTPDHYEVAKKDFFINSKTVAAQPFLLRKSGHTNKEVKIPKKQAEMQKISDRQIIELAKIGAKLEKHYYFPQDIEWAIEKSRQAGRQGKIYIVQTRPVTTTNQKSQPKASPEKVKDQKENYTQRYTLLLKGDPASPGIVSGPVRTVASAKEIGTVKNGEVLVAPQTNPDYVSAMKKAVAVVTDQGGRTSHAAIVSRELGIPAIVGTQTATKTLKTGMVVTVNGTKGEIYKGGHVSLASSSTIPFSVPLKTATKIYVNLAEPELANQVAKQNVDGIGLLRAEFMIAQIGIHPKKLIHDGKKQVFIDQLVTGLETFCRAFHPRPVVYRTSDFKTNEYRNLIGGKDYEPTEPNPMMGYRGAFRYIQDPKTFELELEAIKTVRNKKGLKNLWVMIPYVRTVKELMEVKKIISAASLHRSPSFKLWMMVEIPINVIILDKFIEAGIDGISIGSNDLTMLITGTDRDNSEVAKEFDEQNAAMLWSYEHIIKTAHKYKITSSICGQAPSLYPTLIEKLVSWGITSISVSADAINNTRHIIAETEKKILRNPKR